jgi:single-stranded-DNA-specific exonuclease
MIITTQQTSSPMQLMAEGATVAEELENVKVRVLGNRGATYPEIYSAKNLLNPILLKDGEKAADRLAKAIILKQKIVAVADFDSDGANSAAVFLRGMRMLAEAMIPPTKDSYSRLPTKRQSKMTVDYVIPNRFTYGYGLKPMLAEDIVKPMGPDVVVTLDNGISSHDAVDMIASWTPRTDVIITDHHAPGDTLPKAFAVVNPNRADCEFPSKALCGCGVAFYLLLLVRRSMIKLIGNEPRRAGAARAVKAVPLNNLLDYVAVATIGDLVPMDANNRLLVKAGLERINRGFKLSASESHAQGLLSFGVRSLIEVSGTSFPVTSTDLAFNLVPRINAVGRLEDPIAGIECLLAETQMMADIEAKKCHQLNEDRKQIQKGMEDEAKQIMATLGDQETDAGEQPVTVLFKESWHPGIVGLVASRVKERTKGAVICFSPEIDPNADAGDPNGDPDWLKGSGRSDNVHLRDALAYVAAKAPDLMMQFGGHARAAGLSLHRSDMPRFKKLFAQAVDYFLKTAPLINEKYDDGELPRHLRTPSLANWIELQPWGQMFPEPTFSQTFVVTQAETLKEVHQKLTLADAQAVNQRDYGPENQITMLWFFSVSDEQPKVEIGDTLDVRYKLTVNRFRGKNELQGIIAGATPGQSPSISLDITETEKPTGTARRFSLV